MVATGDMLALGMAEPTIDVHHVPSADAQKLELRFRPGAGPRS